MKNLLLFLLFLSSFIFFFERQVYAQTGGGLVPAVSSGERKVSSEVIVVFKKKPKTRTLLSLRSQEKDVVMSHGIADTQAMVMSVKKGGVKKAISQLQKVHDVAAVFPNYLLRVMFIPNDPLIMATPVPGQPRMQWNMFNLKLAGKSNSAWDISKGSSSVNVAVIDSGVDSSHVDLKDKISSLVDCTGSSCRTVVSMTDDPALSGGHGTHVAGLVAAATNNAKGVAGVGFNTKITVIKIMDREGDIHLSSLVNALRWAADHNSQVVNLSVGILADNLESTGIDFLNDAVSYAWGKGVLLVAAAGNCGGKTNGSQNCAIVDAEGKVIGYAANPKVYPAASDKIISVAALTIDNNLTSYSEHNDSSDPSIGNWISVAAPGGECRGQSDRSKCIISTLPFNQFGYMSGTSMAAPQVAGLASLLFSLNAGLTNVQVKDIIENSADHSVASGQTNNGAVDALKAVSLASSLELKKTPTPSSLVPAASITPTLAPTSLPTVSLSPTNIPRLPKIPPSPFPSAPYCPSLKDCKKKTFGDANCDGLLDEDDYLIWKKQFDQMISPKPVDKNANFFCRKDDPSSYFVDVLDFEFWRRSALLTH